ncbi:MAG: hypothetical protein QME79_03550 [Bacillota bacterium]|nr:hypothetical protein [Bacillota bacterium]
MPAGLRIVNNFVHDLATGFWLALVIAASALRRTLVAAGLLAPGRPVLVLLFRWAVVALAFILFTGVVRAAVYRDGGDADPRLKRRLLLIKHALLGAAFALGTAYLYQLALA